MGSMRVVTDDESDRAVSVSNRRKKMAKIRVGRRILYDWNIVRNVKVHLASTALRTVQVNDDGTTLRLFL